MEDSILAFAVWDDGSGDGPELFVSGGFDQAGGIPVDSIATWNGSEWSDVGGGVHAVRAFAVFDDGTGEALYAGGDFTVAGGVGADHIAKWDGTSWSAVGGGFDERVLCLEVFDDGTGSGPCLFAGGLFQSAGGSAAARIARWDGVAWSPLGAGISGGAEPACMSLCSYDDGTGVGPVLVAGGSFTHAGGSAADNVARWDGSSWSRFGTGTDSMVRAVLSFDDGGGPKLYAGGDFETAGGVTARRIARWNGSNWTPVGGGFILNTGHGHVGSLCAVDFGAGPRLFAGGAFTHSGSTVTKNAAMWTGAGWSPLGTGTNSRVTALCSYDDGAGPGLYVGGHFGEAGGIYRPRFAKWDGTGWPPLGPGLNGAVEALVTFDDGTGGGPALFAGGAFTTAGGLLVNRVAKWDGANWTPLADGFAEGEVYALAVFDDGSGSGPALYAGGSFATSALRVAKWVGDSWVPLGPGIGSPGGTEVVLALEVHDDGTGPALYVGGCFEMIGWQAIRNLAKWDGTSWSALDSGPNSGPDDCVTSLEVYAENGRERLFAGGFFDEAGGVAAAAIARWDGIAWSAVGGGMNHLDLVHDLEVYDDGAGAALHATGYITQAGGAPAQRIARWNGADWATLGTGLDSWGGWTLEVFDDGCGGGPALYVGGHFSSAGGQPARCIGRWDGSEWSLLGTGMDAGPVSALAVFDDGSGGGPALYAGGYFTSATDSGDSYLAKWGHAERPLGFGYCAGDGGGTPCPCDNPGGPDQGCANSTGVGAALVGEGSGSVAADDLVLTASGLPPGQPALLFCAENVVNGGDGSVFGDGLRCAGGGLRRLGVEAADATGASTWGPGLSSAGGWEAGDVRRFQVWYRDPAGSPCGSGFNLSNGYELSFAD